MSKFDMKGKKKFGLALTMTLWNDKVHTSYQWYKTKKARDESWNDWQKKMADPLNYKRLYSRVEKVNR